MHDCQVVDGDLTGEEHDVPVDWIVTPTRCLHIPDNGRAPGRVRWELLDGSPLLSVPPMQELASLRGSRADPPIPPSARSADMTSTAPAPVPAEAPPGVESHGIDLIPQAERHGRPRDLFGMWLGGNLNVFYVVNGAVVISMGLSFAQSLLAIIVGNLAFLAVGFASMQGPRTGTSTFAVSRASYGPNGGRFLAFLNWVTCIGFEASGLALVVLAALAICSRAGAGESTWLKVILILAASAIQAVLPLLGHRAILLTQRRLAWLSTVLFIVMAILVGPKVHLGHLAQGSGWAPVTWAIALVASGGGLSWANTGSDYSRYLASASSARQVFWFSAAGGSAGDAA